MTYKIVGDLSHNEKIEEFPEFSLGEDDYDVDYIDKNETLDFDRLEDFDILFMGNIVHTKTGKKDKITPQQLKDIKKFVGDGGGLLLTSGAGGDQGISMKDGSIRVLYKMTGVRRFWNGVIQETHSNFLVKKENVRITDLFSHPITKGITELVLPKCTFFNLAVEDVEEEVEDIIVTSEKAEFKYFNDDDTNEVGPVPVCTVSEFFNGRCVTLGSSNWLLEDSDFGIDAGDNLKFLENVIKWLAYEI